MPKMTLREGRQSYQGREWVTNSTTIFLYHYSEERFICEKKMEIIWAVLFILFKLFAERNSDVLSHLLIYFLCISRVIKFKQWVFTKLSLYLIVHNYEEKILGDSSRDDSKTITGGWWTIVTFRKNLKVLHPTPKELLCG